LNETAYVEGDNVTILYRFAENQNERMPELAADLVRRQFQLFEIMLMAQWVTAKSAKAVQPRYSR
jgi:transposase